MSYLPKFDDYINNIICGDAIEIIKSFPDKSIDTIITDPPYLKKYLYLYEELAKEAPRILKHGGSLLSICPHYAISTILEMVNKYLKYRWICCMWQGDGQHSRMAMGIEVMWKPLIWWVNGSYPHGRGFVRDGFVNTNKEKLLHTWQQTLSWGDYCMKFVPENGIVLDPFVGTGTIPLSCIKHSKKYIGIEIDKDTYNICIDRINNETKK